MGLAFTFVMAYGGALVALFNPYIGFLIYVAFAILRPEDLWFWSVPQGNYSRILALALIVGWSAKGFGDWRFGKAWPIMLCLLGYLGWLMVSASQAFDQQEAWGWVEPQAKIVLPVLIGLSLIDSVRQLKQLAWVILLSHGYVAYEFNLSFFSGYNRLQEARFGALDNNCVGIAFVACTGLGLFLGIAAGRWWQKGLAFAAVAFLVHAILFSFSRGAMLGLILLGVLAVFLIPKRPVYFVIMALGAAATFQLAGPQVVERFLSSFAEEGQRDTSAESRTEMWGICLRMTAENPLFGLGPHHFPIYAQGFGLTQGKEAHTTWLQMAAEIGVPGVTFLLLYFILGMTFLAPLLWSSQPPPDPWFRDTARIVIAAISGFLFTAQFVTLPGLEAPYFILLLGAGALKLLSDPNLAPANPEARAEPSEVELT